MSNLPNREAFDRLMELLAGQAAGELSAQERAELDRLAAARPTDDSGRPLEPDQIDRMIGALVAGLHETDSASQRPMPANVRERLAARGEALLSGRGGAVVGRIEPKSLQTSTAWVGWVAAAAFAIVAAIGWLRPTPAPIVPTPPTPPAPLSLTESRQNLIANQVDTLQREFGATEDPAAQGVTGDVVWNNRLQEGYLRLRGLAANDPAQLQYQLWIFDKGRPDGMDFPVDGGVFDIAAAQQDPATGDVIVPINAKLDVVDPAAFAITIERPGGVVVTKRERVLVLAAVEG